MQSKSFLFSILFLIVSAATVAQQDKITAAEVLEKAANAYNKNDYISYTSKYALYLDYTTKKVYEQYNGIVVKKNKVNYFKIKNTEFVSFGDSGVKVNHEQKAIIVEKTPRGSIQEPPMSLTSYLKGFNSKMIVTNDLFICELTPKGKFTQAMMNKVVLHIRKSDYSIAKQILFFVEKMENKKVNGKMTYSTPRLEIDFNPRKKNEKADNLLVKKSNYFSEKGNTITLAKRLSAYKLYKS